ncbi:MAG: hypothetical protein R6W96_01210 [Clostridia bacterium]
MRYEIGNDRIRRTWEYKDGKLFTVSLVSVPSGREYVTEPIHENDFFYEGLTYETLVYYRPNAYIFELEEVLEDRLEEGIYSFPASRITFTLYDAYHGIRIRVRAVLHDNTSVIRVFHEVQTRNMPSGYFFTPRYNAIDSLPLNHLEASLEAYEFFTHTDHNNHLVEKHFPDAGFEKGNVLVADFGGGGVFFLKESPCFTDQRPECEGNFFIGDGVVHTLGWGILPHEFQDREMTTYASATGVYEGIKDNAFLELKQYQMKKNRFKACLVANPWGGNRWMEQIGEEYVLEEIRACAKLHAEYYQIDDGWNRGYGLIHVGYSKALEKDFWQIKEEFFPEGFGRIVREARENGLRIALWFAPDCNTMYRDWERQAEILYGFHQEYGIDLFKIDIMKLRSKESEENIEKMFRRLRDMSGGKILFNLDVTNDRRSGYFMFGEYGSIFLENRYTQKKTYYPHMTLKNLWDLSLFVCPQNFQIEFTDIGKNTELYEQDGLEPSSYPFAYVAAIPFFANPLCWLEPSQLDHESMAASGRMMELHLAHRKAIHAGHIFPVGMRPDGYSFTGFVSLDFQEKTGVMVAFRENCPVPEHLFSIPWLQGKTPEVLEDLVNDWSGHAGWVGEQGFMVRLEDKKSFIIFRFQWR